MHRKLLSLEQIVSHKRHRTNNGYDTTWAILDSDGGAQDQATTFQHYSLHPIHVHTSTCSSRKPHPHRNICILETQKRSTAHIHMTLDQLEKNQNP